MAVDLDGAAHHVHIALAAGVDRHLGGFVAVEQAGVHGGVGVQLDRPLGAVGRPDQAQGAAFFGRVKTLLLVAGRNAFDIRLDPDLQEMGGLVGRMVELRVHHAAAGAHALDVARRNRLDVAHAVLVRQFTRQHVGNDFHVAVAVLAETGTRGHLVFIDDAQIAPTHVLGIVVLAEGKRVLAFQPAEIGLAAVLRVTNCDHGVLLWLTVYCVSMASRRDPLCASMVRWRLNRIDGIIQIISTMDDR